MEYCRLGHRDFAQRKHVKRRGTTSYLSSEYELHPSGQLTKATEERGRKGQL